MPSPSFDHSHIPAKSVWAEHVEAGYRGTQPPREYRHWQLVAFWTFLWLTLGVF